MEKFLDAVADIHANPDAVERAYMARQLVLCTMPHRDPGDVPVWTRTNGDITLVIARTGFDGKTGTLVGYPYGTIPRLLLFWLTAEAVRTKKRRIELGSNLAAFMRAIGLNPGITGKRGDVHRLREQATRLFGASISFQQTGNDGNQNYHRLLNMGVVSEAELWWSPRRPEQGSLWDSWVVLGENFFNAITAAPVPLDIRVLRALKQSPFALDLYAWATYKAYVVGRKDQPQFVSWEALQRQLGADYGDLKHFRQKAMKVMKKVVTLYPGFKMENAEGGFYVLPGSTPSVRRRGGVKNPVVIDLQGG